MRKKVKITVYFMLIILFIQPFLANVQAIDDGGGFTHFPSPDSTSGGSGASEEELIDNFNVHPKNRWEISNNGFDSEVDDGLFHVNGTGDGGPSADTYLITRGLDNLDDKIEFMFKYSTNIPSYGANDYFWLYLTNGSEPPGISSYFIFGADSLTNNSYAPTSLSFDNTDDADKVLEVDADECFWPDEWYKVVITYDCFKSELKTTAKYENGTKLFSYSYYDIHKSTPLFFANQKLTLGLYHSVKTDGKQVDLYYQYIKAPFKQRDWEQTISGYDADTDFLMETPFAVLVQDDIFWDESEWQIVVPDLDVVSGTMFHGGGSLDANDECYMSLVLYGVDADDGDQHKIAEIRLNKRVTPPSGVNFSIRYGNGSVADSYVHGTAAYTPKADFQLSLVEDRSLVEISGRCWQDHSDEDSFGDVVALIEVDDFVTVPSNEFVLRTFYYLEFDADTEFVMKFEEFTWLEKNIFIDIGRGIVLEIFFFFASIFPSLFRFLAKVFKVVGDVIVTALEALEPFFGIIRDAVEGLEVFLTAIGDAIGDIASDIWSGVGSALDFIADFIWPALQAAMSDIIGWVFDVLGTIFEVIITFLADLLFWFWDALGLPDILAIADILLTGLIQFITGLPQFLMDWIGFLGAISFLFVILGFIWIFILPIAIADTAGGCVEKIIDNMFTDLSGGASFLGISIPIPMVIPWGLLIIYTILIDTIFYGFF